MGCLVRLERGRISIEIRNSQAYNVIDRRFVVKTGIDSCTNAKLNGKSRIGFSLEP